MIGLLAQQSLMLDQIVLLTKQSLFSGESLSQLDFRVPVADQLAFADFDCAMFLAINYNDRRGVRALRQMFKLKQRVFGLVGFRAGRKERLVTRLPELTGIPHGTPSRAPNIPII